MVEISANDYAREWDRHPDSYSVLKYFGKKHQNANAVTDLILDFKANFAAAVAQCIDVVATDVAKQGFLKKDDILVAAPRSTAGLANEPSEAVCARLAKDLGLVHLRHALKRTETVPKSRGGTRVPLARHFETIRCNTSMSLKSKRVVVIDDLRTTGTTVSACAQRLLNEGASAVFAVYVGRTQWR